MSAKFAFFRETTAQRTRKALPRVCGPRALLRPTMGPIQCASTCRERRHRLITPPCVRDVPGRAGEVGGGAAGKICCPSPGNRVNWLSRQPSLNGFHHGISATPHTSREERRGAACIHPAFGFSKPVCSFSASAKLLRTRSSGARSFRWIARAASTLQRDCANCHHLGP